ncbi:predicted protein [Plenodomus lingam JN3]|uniref:Predicted protein n=1 Tax=Leptosphaeria maculans (strain JN3 / isolate v23.1.3 / race Av1-4-5-6-7-8) TaxID=985895 RepID=E5AE49_LEPMJ|nr:predicted protein [Plenodomus lingam JN3]CBY01488.1 predicted protein [Plenodomus lingam JN3]
MSKILALGCFCFTSCDSVGAEDRHLDGTISHQSSIV